MDSTLTEKVDTSETASHTTQTIIPVATPSTVKHSQLKRSLVPARWQDSVRTVSVAEAKEAALSLAHAFADDDFANYLLDTEDMAHMSAEEKWRLHVDIMTYIVTAHCYDGIVTTIGPDYESVALWVPPSQNIDSWWTTLRSGLWRLSYQLSAEARKRFFGEMCPLLHDTKAAVMGERDHASYYLVYIGTKPNGRSKGYAHKLIAHMLQRADAENRPTYLESTTISNNAYYARFGFEPKRDIYLKRGPVPVKLCIMVREPQNTSAKSVAAARKDKVSAASVASAVGPGVLKRLRGCSAAVAASAGGGGEKMMV